MCDHCGCRAFAPIADLTAEHEWILAEAWKIAEATGAGREAAPDAVAGLLALLDIHVTKEEEGLYPELSKLGGLADTDRADLEEEHRVLRIAIAGGGFDRREYFALAAHIETEELELFSAARFSFDERDWDDLEAIHRTANKVKEGALQSP